MVSLIIGTFNRYTISFVLMGPKATLLGRPISWRRAAMGRWASQALSQRHFLLWVTALYFALRPSPLVDLRLIDELGGEPFGLHCMASPWLDGEPLSLRHPASPLVVSVGLS